MDKNREIRCISCRSHYFLSAHSGFPHFCPFCGVDLETRGGERTLIEEISTGVSFIQGLTPESGSVKFSLGNYQILELVGKGGMGEVFLAYDTSCGRRIALKRIRADLEEKRALHARFLKEAHITSQLTHPGVIPIYAIHEQDDLIYYTMPYVEGQTLKQILRTTRNQEKAGIKLDHLGGSIPALARVFVSICQAVAYSHSHKILHRDLKPENIMIGKYGEVMILDWGLAVMESDVQNSNKQITPEANSLTQIGKVVGTIAYMAPERGMGKPATRQADIYALGVILYQMLTLHMPFRRGDLKEFRRTVRYEKLMEPSEVAPYRDVPNILAAICKKSLSSSPEGRYREVEEMLRDIENYIEGRSEWFSVDILDPHNKNDWEFQENVFLAQHAAITRNTETIGWVSLMISRLSFSSNLKISAKVRISEKGHGLGIMLCIPEKEERKNLNDGYCLWMGSKEEHPTKLLRANVEVLSAPAVSLSCGSWHQITIEKTENSLIFTLDGTQCFNYVSHMPVVGTHVGLIARDGNYEIQDLEISTGGNNVTVNCLAVPDAFLAHKNFDHALIEYRRIGYAFPGRAEGREALFRAGITLLEKARETGEFRDYEIALEEFEKLHNTPGAPFEYLGKGLVYQALGDLHEEIKCYTLAVRRYLRHPLLNAIKEQIIFRMHECSHYHRHATYDLIFLVVRFLPAVAEEKHAINLFNSLQKHWEQLPFLADNPEDTHQFALRIAFWLNKPYFLGEMIDEQIHHAMIDVPLLKNLFFSLLYLDAGEFAEKKLHLLESDHHVNIDEVQQACKIVELAIQSYHGELGSAVDTAIKTHTIKDRQLLLWLLDRTIDEQQIDLLLKIYKHLDDEHRQDQEIIYRILWGLLLVHDYVAAAEIFDRFPTEELTDDNTPLHFLYGCWLEAQEGNEIASIHFSGILETTFPRTWALASHYINGYLDPEGTWGQRAFPYEIKQLWRHLALFYHCADDEQKLEVALEKSHKKLN